MTTRKKSDSKLISSADEMATQLPYDEFNLSVPKGFPEHIISAKAAKALVNSECWTDANPMLNLSSFVTTFCEPEAREVFAEGSFRNFADPDMYPHTKDMEFACVRWLHDLWNGPKDSEPYGSATIGSSEACMLGGLAHKWNWREARKKAVENAMAKAAVYANAAGLKLGSILSMVEEGATVQVYAPRSATFSAAGAAPVPVEAGEETLQARILLVIELKS